MNSELIFENTTVLTKKMSSKTYVSEEEKEEEANKSFISAMLLENKYALINGKKYTNLDKIIQLWRSGNVIDFTPNRQYCNVEKIYLYVPFDYKDGAKKLGAKFDWKVKEWYVEENHPNKQKLIDLYHDRNFIDKTIVQHDELITYEERCQEIKGEMEFEKLEALEYNEMRKKWIETYDDDDYFDDWYYSGDDKYADRYQI
jgi:hypothetical protein